MLLPGKLADLQGEKNLIPICSSIKKRHHHLQFRQGMPLKLQPPVHQAIEVLVYELVVECCVVYRVDDGTDNDLLICNFLERLT